MVTTSLQCRLISADFTTCPRMSMYQVQWHRMKGENVILRLLAALYQWRRCFGSLKGFQSCLIVREDTDLFFWSNVCLDFVTTGKYSIYIYM